MECESCNTEKMRILGKEYCPTCEKKDFSLKIHSGKTLVSDSSVRAILWGTATALSLVVLFTFLSYLIITSDSPALFPSIFMGIVSLGSAGMVVAHFDPDNYFSDNLFVSFVLSLILAIYEYFLGASNYFSIFFSAIIVFIITMLLGSAITLLSMRKASR